MKNIHAGPDFIESRIKIGDIDWAGSVEIHVKSSDWIAHRHVHNPDYNKVILHVVWRHDMEIKRIDGSTLPTLEISKYVSKGMIARYSELMFGNRDYPCHSYLSRIRGTSLHVMMVKAVFERLEKKSTYLLTVWNDASKDWEETAYRTLVRNFGFKVNQDNMYLLAKLLPFSVVKKHRESVFQLEALLFGMAGFLEVTVDGYSMNLKSEFDYLCHKYSIHSGFLNRYHWKFLRLRPQNFPTIRLAQLATLLMRFDKIFSAIIDFSSVKSIINLLNVQQSPYWLSHYDFGRKYKRQIRGLGEESIQNILVNTFATVLTAYSRQINSEAYFKKAILILESLPPEDNHIIRKWRSINVMPLNALESQGLIELSNAYCCKKKCLNCDVGRQILMN